MSMLTHAHPDDSAPSPFWCCGVRTDAEDLIGHLMVLHGWGEWGAEREAARQQARQPNPDTAATEEQHRGI